jgi:hypothetical protein
MTRNDVRIRFHYVIYAVVLLGVGVARMGQKIANNEGGIISQYGPLAFACLMSVCVVSYALRAPILKRCFWRVLLFTLVAVDCLAVAFTAYLSINAVSLFEVPVTIILGALLLTLPALVIMYYYSHNRNSIWYEKTN